MPMPSILRKTISDEAYVANDAARMTAAEVISGPLRSRPAATAPALSPVRSYSSLIRDSMKTS